jgi:hypothetical protein
MTAVSAINSFSLRPGVTTEQFEAFSAELDRPTCLAFDVVEAFEVYVVQGGGSGVDVVEVMTVTSWPEWEAVRDSAPELGPVVKRFEELVEPGSVSTLFARSASTIEEN